MPNKSCLFVGCKSNSRNQPDLRFARFCKPSFDVNRAKLWIQKVNRPDFTLQRVTKYSYICEKHFPVGAELDYRKNLTLTPAAYGEDRNYVLPVPKLPEEIDSSYVVTSHLEITGKSGDDHSYAYPLDRCKATLEEFYKATDIPNVIQLTHRGLTIHKTEFYDPLDVSVPEEEDFQPVLQKPTKTYKKPKLKTYMRSARTQPTDEMIPKPPVKTYSGKRANRIVKKSEQTTESEIVKIEPVDPLLI